MSMYLRKRLFCCLIIILISLTTTSLAVAAQDTMQQPKEEVPKVTSKIFLIVIDGLQAETLQKTSAPNINGIANTGIRCNQVISVFPDTTQATVTSVLTGMQPQRHKFLQKGDKFEGKTIQTLMEEKQIKTAFFGAEGELKKLQSKNGHNCSGPFNGKDELVITNLLNEWNQEPSYFNVIVMPQLREDLKKHGVKSNEYKMAVTRTDSQVGRLLKKLHDENIFDNSMIIITGTLGEPPLIIKGLSFEESNQMPPVSICDIAPTIGYLNGVTLGEMDGLVLWNSFKEIGGQSKEYLLNERVKDLSEANAHLLQEMTRLQEEKLEVKQQQEIVAREKDDIQRQIEIRDKKIDGFKNRITIYHLVALGALGFFGLGYIIMYRLLRKRFLMF